MEAKVNPKFLHARLKDYIDAYAHMPRQHTNEWINFKKTTIGGSQMAVIQGNNPYEDIKSMVASKIGIGKNFKSTIKTQWGNLFEEVIRVYVEHDKNTEIIGDDILISHTDNISYSPDGLGVIMVPTKSYVQSDDGGPPKEVTIMMPKVALFEFKCPFNRIPDGKVPIYYVPQVKTGLDIIDIADVGVFAEAVFRRCSWDDLDRTPKYDRSLVPRASGRQILAYGFIGFYSPNAHWIGEAELELQSLENLLQSEGFEINDTNDLGVCEPETFKALMRLFDLKYIHTWYSDIVYLDGTCEDNSSEELDAFVKFVHDQRNYIWGILPWKLFRIDYHYIDKEPGYLNPYRAKIDEVIGVVRKCLADPSRKIEVFREHFAEASTEDGFSYDD